MIGIGFNRLRRGPGDNKRQISVCFSVGTLVGQTFSGGAMVARVFEDTVSSQFVVSSLSQTYTGGAITAQTFGS